MHERLIRIAFLFLLTVIPVIGFAEDDGVTAPVRYRVVEDVVYGHKEGMALTMDVLVPAIKPKNVGVILVSSGSWNSKKSNVVEENEEGRQKTHWIQGLLKGGYTLFVVRHASSPRFTVPEMVADMNRAVRFVRKSARLYKVDPDRLAITSGSSGGHLSLMAAVTGDDGNPASKDPVERCSSKVQCVVAWFPPTDLVNWGAPGGYSLMELVRPGIFKRILGEVKDIVPQLKAISPIYHVKADSPPLLLIHGDSDKTVPLQQSEVMKAKYDELGLPARLVVHPGGGHSSWPGVMDQYPAVWEWIDQYLASPKPTASKEPAKPESTVRNRFNLETLSKTPEVYPAPDLQIEGVKSLFYRGVDYKGKPTKVFAYYNAPAVDQSQGHKKYPAMVLIHGGGGTAYHDWVKMWSARGYAAISMDLCGCIPVGAVGQWTRHADGGPPGWDASFNQLDDAIEDQWTYHAASAVALAHSLIRSYPEVDTDRIGVTGISWGGYMTSVVSGIDSRFKFAVPVYGCGYLGDNSAWLPAFEKLGPERAKLWLQQWDPSGYLSHAKMPMLWVNGTNDFAYPMDSWQRSYDLPAGTRELCLKVRMPHSHPAGQDPVEIHAFAESFFNAGKPLVKIADQGQSGDQAWATYQSSVPVVSAELNFTRDIGRWQERKWETEPAKIDADQHRVTAQIPADAKVFYLNLFDDRKCIVSTRHVER